MIKWKPKEVSNSCVREGIIAVQRESVGQCESWLWVIAASTILWAEVEWPGDNGIFKIKIMLH